MAGVLFILEDNKELVEDLSYIAKSHGITVSQARCVDHGVSEAKRLKLAGTRPVLGIVDLMLPQTPDDLAQLDGLLAHRERIIEGVMSCELPHVPQEAMGKARLQLLAIDADIRKLINMEGGLRFLELAKDCFDGWEQVIFSARSWERVKDGVAQILGAGFDSWWQKPIDADQVARALQDKLIGDRK